MGPPPAPLYFWSCVWLSPHGPGPSNWRMDNNGVLFVVGQEKQWSFLIGGLGHIQSILRFALLKHFILLPCRQQLQQEAFICLPLRLLSSHECNSILRYWTHAVSEDGISLPCHGYPFQTSPAYSGLIDRSKNAEIYASTEFNPKFFTTKLIDLHKQVGFVHAVLFNFPFSGVAVHYLDEANLPHWLSWCCLPFRRHRIGYCPKRSG